MVSQFGDFALDVEQRVLSRASLPVHLTPKAFDLLALLIAAAPRVVGKAELHARLWPGTFVSDATLVGVMKEVRRALADNGAEPIIRTVHRVGYAFAVPLMHGTPAFRGREWHWLVLLGRRWPLRQGDNVIGRDPQAQVWIDATGVSRRHASIHVDGTCSRIEDLGSKNGTTVSGAVISSPAPLHDGDRITFGPVAGVYRASSAGMSTETTSRGMTGSRAQRPPTGR